MNRKVVQFKKGKNKGVEKMSTRVSIKPIQATPALSGIEAKTFIEQVLSKPNQIAVEHNKRLLTILDKIKK